MSKRVLIVDDEKNMRWVLGQALEGEGFDVAEAEDGKSALDAVSGQKVDKMLAVFDENIISDATHEVAYFHPGGDTFRGSVNSGDYLPEEFGGNLRYVSLFTQGRKEQEQMPDGTLSSRE